MSTIKDFVQIRTYRGRTSDLASDFIGEGFGHNEPVTLSRNQRHFRPWRSADLEDAALKNAGWRRRVIFDLSMQRANIAMPEKEAHDAVFRRSMGCVAVRGCSGRR